ncbi:hypothetical protein ABB28_09790, partial [Stenotrophomonas chelatiphaga]
MGDGSVSYQPNMITNEIIRRWAVIGYIWFVGSRAGDTPSRLAACKLLLGVGRAAGLAGGRQELLLRASF